MAMFTMELHKVIELTDGAIGLDEYPIFDEAYRIPLNKKIVDRYHSREIGMESIPMFVHAMKRRMNEIMPYYNQLYKSELLQIAPLETFRTVMQAETDAESKTTSDTDTEASNVSTSTGQSRTVSSDFPQVRLAGDGDYASSAQDAASESQASGNAQDKSHAVQDGTQRQQQRSESSGFSGSQAELLMRYRQTFLNIDLMILEELSNLFMLV